MERKRKSVKQNDKISFPSAYSPNTNSLFVAFFLNFFEIFSVSGGTGKKIHKPEL